MILIHLCVYLYNSRLARTTFEEFEALQMICHYCGEFINDENVNSDCFANIFRRDRDLSGKKLIR